MAATVFLTQVAATDAVSSPLMKADEGFEQCYEANDDAKTCQSLATYSRNSDGTWTNTAVVLVSPAQPITLETATPVTVKDGAICGFIRKDDLLDGKLRYSGNLLPSDEAAPILAKIADGMSAMMDKEICTTYLGDGNDLLAKVKIDGAGASLPEQRVRWVRQSDGYSVAPARLRTNP